MGPAERLIRLRAYLLPTEPERAPTGWRKLWLYAVFVARRWLFEDSSAGLAAILTIATLLSTVPVVGIALLAVNRMAPDAGAALLENVFSLLVPESSRAQTMANVVLTYGSNVSVAKLGGWGFIVALSLAFVLFSQLEKTFNRIWRVRRKRNVFVKFTMFYTIATLGPLLLFYSLAQPLIASMSEAVASPLLTTTVALVVLNRLMPNTPVSWIAALAGGLFSAVLFETGKVVFGMYLTRVAFDTYQGLYGPLAALPVFVIWSFISWLMVSLGAELAFVIQHRRAIALQGYINPYLREGVMETASGRTAARLLLAICDGYDRQGRGTTLDQLAERFQLPLDHVGNIIAHLQGSGFVLEADRPEPGYVPGRPLDQLRIADVLAAFDDEASQDVRDDRLSQLFEDLERARVEIVSETTLQDLIAAQRKSSSEQPHPGADVVELDGA